MTKTVTSERIEEIRRWLADETKLDPYWYPEEIVSICAELLQRRGTVEPEADSDAEDAARYRWLKANHLQTGPDSWIRTGEDLEEAIDASRR